MKQAIDRSRALQVERRQKERETENKEAKEFAEFWKVRNQELQQAEQQEALEEKERQLELVKFLAKQSEIKKTKAEEQFKLDNVASLQTQALLDQ